MEDATGTLKLHKCKGPARPGGRALSNLVPRYYGPGSEACACAGPQLSPPGRRKKFFKKSECGSPGGEGACGAPCSPIALATGGGSEGGGRSIGGLRVPSAVKRSKAEGGDQPGAHRAVLWGPHSEMGSQGQVCVFKGPRPAAMSVGWHGAGAEAGQPGGAWSLALSPCEEPR